MTDVISIGFWGVWGVGLPIVYGMLMWKRAHNYRVHRDRRAFRPAMEAIGWFIVSLAAAIGVTVALFGPGTGLGRIFFAVASAAFLVVGIYALLEQPDGAARHR